jgi:hypothetical protein
MRCLYLLDKTDGVIGQLVKQAAWSVYAGQHTV